MVTALCNIYINSEEKLTLFKETFSVVYKISDNWLINIRGKYKNQVLNHIKKFPKSKNNCIFFNDLWDNNWAKSTTEMLKKSKYDYIYVFLEDHFLQQPLEHFKQVIESMKKNKIDYFQHSFFNIGLPENSIEYLYPETVDHFYTVNLNSEKLLSLRILNKSFYPYSLASVSSKIYFNKLLNIEKKHLIKVPFSIQVLIHVLMENIIIPHPIWFHINQLTTKMGVRFVILPPSTPFNLEKSVFDCDKELLPLKVGVLKEELFANWDDDNMLNGSSLIKRGLYPKYFRTQGLEKPNLSNSKEYFLKKGKKSDHQYCPDIPRTIKIPKKFIYIKEGELKISSKDESFILKKGQSSWVASNIPHELVANEDCTYSYYIDTGL